MTAAGAPRELGRFLTIADVADLLSITALEATHLVTSGQIPAIRVGTHRHWRIERPMLDAYIEAQYLASEIEVRWQGYPSNVIDLDVARRPVATES
jgi:excisionase family DNA binding protein